MTARNKNLGMLALTAAMGLAANASAQDQATDVRDRLSAVRAQVARIDSAARQDASPADAVRTADADSTDALWSNFNQWGNQVGPYGQWLNWNNWLNMA